MTDKKKPLDDKKSLEGRKFRFVVKSAEEAVRLIKEHLGEDAKVLSVNQVEGKGLARFVSSPRLEVIATVPKKEVPQPVTEEPKQEEVVVKKETEAEVVKEAYSKASKAFDNVAKTDAFSEGTNLKNFEKEDRLRKDKHKKSLELFLEKAGFDGSILAGFQSLNNWSKIKNETITHGLMELSDYLKKEYKSLEKRPLGKRIAFIGTPGSGKTTALCKQLAREVFLNQKSVQVLKLEGEMADIDDSLAIFCDVLGVKIFRDGLDSHRIDPEKTLYIDTPGLVLDEKNYISEIAKKLDEFDVDTRVLVINGLYESSQLKRLYDLGTMLRGTHVVLSHMDEVSSASRLWQFVLRGGLSPLFISHGQNLTGDFSLNVEEFLNQKTFSSILTT